MPPSLAWRALGRRKPFQASRQLASRSRNPAARLGGVGKYGRDKPSAARRTKSFDGQSAAFGVLRGACRRGRPGGSRGRAYRALPRPFPGGRAGFEPARAQRDSDGQGDMRHRFRNFVRRLDRQEIERHAAAHSPRGVGARLRAARVHDEFRSLARRSRRADRRRGGGVFAVNCARQEQLRSHEPFYCAPRPWRYARQLVARLGDRPGDRRGARRRFWISRRLSCELRLRRRRTHYADAGKSRPEPRRASVGPDPRPANGGATIAIAFAALALFHMAMFLGSIPLAIVITDGLGGAQSDVGWAYSLCAGLEVIVMGAIVWRPLRQHERAAIMVGFAAFVAYFAVLVFAQSVALVLWAQILRAIAIGIVSYLGIGFLHSLLPHRPGVAAALFPTPDKSAPWRRRSPSVPSQALSVTPPSSRFALCSTPSGSLSSGSRDHSRRARTTDARRRGPQSNPRPPASAHSAFQVASRFWSAAYGRL